MKKEERLSELFLFFEGLFRKCAIGAIDRVGTGVPVPIRALFDGVPLCFGAAKPDAREAIAIIERIKVDARHAVRDCDARETFATIERRRADARHAIRDRDAREARAFIERIRTDARHAAVARDDAVFTACNQRFAFRFNQAIARAVI